MGDINSEPTLFNSV